MCTLDPAALKSLTGFATARKQAEWVRRELRLDPPIGADGRPRLTQDAVTQAIMRRNGATPSAAPASSGAGPNWTRRAA